MGESCVRTRCGGSTTYLYVIFDVCFYSGVCIYPYIYCAVVLLGFYWLGALHGMEYLLACAWRAVSVDVMRWYCVVACVFAFQAAFRASLLHCGAHLDCVLWLVGNALSLSRHSCVAAYLSCMRFLFSLALQACATCKTHSFTVTPF